MSVPTKTDVMTWWPRGPIARRTSVLELLAQRDELLAALEKAETFIVDDTCRHDSEKAPVLFVVRAAIAKARSR